MKTIPLVDPSQMTGLVVDICQANEHAAGHVPGAINVELWQVPDAARPDGPLTTMCGIGERAMTAASLLAQRGRSGVVVLDDRPDTWTSATGLPLDMGR